MARSSRAVAAEQISWIGRSNSRGAVASGWPRSCDPSARVRSPQLSVRAISRAIPRSLRSAAGRISRQKPDLGFAPITSAPSCEQRLAFASDSSGLTPPA